MKTELLCCTPVTCITLNINYTSIKKSHLTTCTGVLFWGLYSVPIVHRTVLMPVPQSSDYCGFVEVLKSGSRRLFQEANNPIQIQAKDLKSSGP